MSKVYFNKEIHASDKLLLKINNSAFLFGQSVFSSGLIIDSKVLYLDEHMNRTLRAVSLIFGDDSDFGPEVREGFKLLCNELNGTHRFRLTFFKEDKVFFLITVDQNNLTQESIKAGIKVKSLRGEFIPEDIKLGNYSNEIYLKDNAEKEGYNDILFVSSNDQLLEFTSGNIILGNKDEIVTPYEKGIFAGITRQKLIDKLNVKQKDISLSDLEKYEFAFLVNSVKLLVPVERIGNREFNINYEINKIFIKRLREEL